MKNKIFFSLFIIITLGVLISLGYREDDLRISPSYKSSSMHGLHLTHKASNEIKWELKARNATFPEGGGEIILSSLELRVHDDYGMNLSAGSGTYKIDKKILTIKRPVQINIRDIRLITDTLTWDGEEGLIKTEDDIRFSGKNFYIEGTGLEAEIKYQRIRILKNVKGTFYL